MDPSTPTTAPSGKRKKQPKSCRLVRLPDPILLQIFESPGVSKSSVLGLCRALYPAALKVFYCHVHLNSREQMQRFAWTLRRNPERAHLVCCMSLMDKRITKEDARPAGWCSEDGDGGAGQLVDFDAAASYTSIVVGVGLLKDVVRMLPNLEALLVTGSVLYSPLLACDFLTEMPYPRLKLLDLSHVASLQEELPRTLGHDLVLIPSLKIFTLHGLGARMPFDLLNLSPTSMVSPRSLHLESFNLSMALFLWPEIRHLFQALATGIKTVSIECWWAYPTVLHDVALLPASVECMVLSFGRQLCANAAAAASPDYALTERAIAVSRERAPFLHPLKLVAVLWNFPNLADLRLEGDTVMPETFDLLLSLPSLRTLSLGPHTRFTTSSLVCYLRATSTLDAVYVHVCECVPVPTGASKRTSRITLPPRPAWREGFDADDARAITQACCEEGIAAGGTLVCAARVVTSEMPHQCRGWCK
ncbi:hypothetical protein JCM10449v2_005287 [Rhodotorula kratochvilovae]